eukprot:jgi/Mesvir1/17212/Mv07626-RA.1
MPIQTFYLLPYLVCRCLALAFGDDDRRQHDPAPRRGQFDGAEAVGAGGHPGVEVDVYRDHHTSNSGKASSLDSVPGPGVSSSWVPGNLPSSWRLFSALLEQALGTQESSREGTNDVNAHAVVDQQCIDGLVSRQAQGATGNAGRGTHVEDADARSQRAAATRMPATASHRADGSGAHPSDSPSAASSGHHPASQPRLTWLVVRAMIHCGPAALGPLLHSLGRQLRAAVACGAALSLADRGSIHSTAGGPHRHLSLDAQDGAMDWASLQDARSQGAVSQDAPSRHTSVPASGPLGATGGRDGGSSSYASAGQSLLGGAGQGWPQDLTRKNDGAGDFAADTSVGDARGNGLGEDLLLAPAAFSRETALALVEVVERIANSCPALLRQHFGDEVRWMLHTYARSTLEGRGHSWARGGCSHLSPNRDSEQHRFPGQENEWVEEIGTQGKRGRGTLDVTQEGRQGGGQDEERDGSQGQNVREPSPRGLSQRAWPLIALSWCCPHASLLCADVLLRAFNAENVLRLCYSAFLCDDVDRSPGGGQGADVTMGEGSRGAVDVNTRHSALTGGDNAINSSAQGPVPGQRGEVRGSSKSTVAPEAVQLEGQRLYVSNAGFSSSTNLLQPGGRDGTASLPPCPDASVASLLSPVTSLMDRWQQLLPARPSTTATAAVRHNEPQDEPMSTSSGAMDGGLPAHHPFAAADHPPTGHCKEEAELVSAEQCEWTGDELLASVSAWLLALLVRRLPVLATSWDLLPRFVLLLDALAHPSNAPATWGGVPEHGIKDGGSDSSGLRVQGQGLPACLHCGMLATVALRTILRHVCATSTLPRLRSLLGLPAQPIAAIPAQPPAFSPSSLSKPSSQPSHPATSDTPRTQQHQPSEARQGPSSLQLRHPVEEQSHVEGTLFTDDAGASADILPALAPAILELCRRMVGTKAGQGPAGTSSQMLRRGSEWDPSIYRSSSDSTGVHPFAGTFTSIEGRTRPEETSMGGFPTPTSQSLFLSGEASGDGCCTLGSWLRRAVLKAAVFLDDRAEIPEDPPGSGLCSPGAEAMESDGAAPSRPPSVDESDGLCGDGWRLGEVAGEDMKACVRLRFLESLLIASTNQGRARVLLEVTLASVCLPSSPVSSGAAKPEIALPGGASCRDGGADSSPDGKFFKAFPTRVDSASQGPRQAPGTAHVISDLAPGSDVADASAGAEPSLSWQQQRACRLLHLLGELSLGAIIGEQGHGLAFGEEVVVPFLDACMARLQQGDEGADRASGFEDQALAILRTLQGVVSHVGCPHPSPTNSTAHYPSALGPGAATSGAVDISPQPVAEEDAPQAGPVHHEFGNGDSSLMDGSSHLVTATSCPQQFCHEARRQLVARHWLRIFKLVHQGSSFHASLVTDGSSGGACASMALQGPSRLRAAALDLLLALPPPVHVGLPRFRASVYAVLGYLFHLLSSQEEHDQPGTRAGANQEPRSMQRDDLRRGLGGMAAGQDAAACNSSVHVFIDHPSRVLDTPSMGAGADVGDEPAAGALGEYDWELLECLEKLKTIVAALARTSAQATALVVATVVDFSFLYFAKRRGPTSGLASHTAGIYLDQVDLFGTFSVVSPATPNGRPHPLRTQGHVLGEDGVTDDSHHGSSMLDNLRKRKWGVEPPKAAHPNTAGPPPRAGPHFRPIPVELELADIISRCCTDTGAADASTATSMATVPPSALPPGRAEGREEAGCAQDMEVGEAVRRATDPRCGNSGNAYLSGLPGRHSEEDTKQSSGDMEDKRHGEREEQGSGECEDQRPHCTIRDAAAECVVSHVLERLVTLQAPSVTVEQYNEILPRRPSFPRHIHLVTCLNGNPLLLEVLELFARQGRVAPLWRCFELLLTLLADAIGLWNNVCRGNSRTQQACAQHNEPEPTEPPSDLRTHTVRLLCLLSSTRQLPHPLDKVAPLADCLPPPDVLELLLLVWGYLQGRLFPCVPRGGPNGPADGPPGAKGARGSAALGTSIADVAMERLTAEGDARGSASGIRQVQGLGLRDVGQGAQGAYGQSDADDRMQVVTAEEMASRLKPSLHSTMDRESQPSQLAGQCFPEKGEPFLEQQVPVSGGQVSPGWTGSVGLPVDSCWWDLQLRAILHRNIHVTGTQFATFYDM